MSWTDLPKGCTCSDDASHSRNSNRIELSPRTYAPGWTATGRPTRRSTAGSSARTISDWWVSVAVRLIRPVEKYHAWKVRRAYRKGHFGSGAVTTRSREDLGR